MPPRKKQKVATAPLELTPEEQAIEDRKATYTISGSLTDTLTENQQREWLDRSRTWPSLAYGIHHQRWMPVKVLGGGKNGIVGLWRFQSRDGDDQQDAEENELDRIPKYMAIKQSGRAADSDGATDSQGADARLNMQWESKLLHQIMGTQTEHVIKIYKGYHLDGGSGVDPKIDPISFNEDGNYNTDLAVSRIYLEYCEGGDMKNYADYRKKEAFVIPEEHVWRILLCIFKALLLLEQGHEDPAEKGKDVPTLVEPWGQPIAHFDIKPDNILIGARDLDKHKRLEIFKLSDFGSAMHIPRDLSEKWMNEAGWRKTADYMPPEQFFMQHTQRRSITQQTGVWSAASSIIEMCCGKRVNQTESFANPLYTSGQITSGEPKILFNTVALPYSKKLIETLLRCLAFNPTERIKISAVVRLAQKVVDQFDAIERVISDNPLHNRTEVNLLPGNKTIHSLGDYTPLTFKVGGVRRDDQYVCGNEPPLPPERGPPLLFDSVFFGSEKVIGDGKTLADYPYTMLEAGAEPAQRTRRSKK